MGDYITYPISQKVNSRGIDADLGIASGEKMTTHRPPFQDIEYDTGQTGPSVQYKAPPRLPGQTVVFHFTADHLSTKVTFFRLLDLFQNLFHLVVSQVCFNLESTTRPIALAQQTGSQEVSSVKRCFTLRCFVYLRKTLLFSPFISC